MVLRPGNPRHEFPCFLILPSPCLRILLLFYYHRLRVRMALNGVHLLSNHAVQDDDKLENLDIRLIDVIEISLSVSMI